MYQCNRTRIPRWLPAAALAALGPAACRAATYYVAPTGSDLNKGSQAAPFRQIRAALKIVNPGDTVLVSDGVYLGFDVDSIDGLPGEPITVRAVGSNASVVPTTDREDNRDTIFVTFSSYVVLDGLHSNGANRAAIRIDNSANITVRNGKYGMNNTWGIFTDFSSHLLLERNECYGSRTQHGIYVSNSSYNPTVRWNKLHDNYACGLHMNGDLSQGGIGLITSANVEYNVVYNNGVGGGGGINMDGVQNSVIRNNLLYNNHASGITMYRIDGAAGPHGNLVANNTIDMPTNGRWALLISDTSGQNIVLDNVLNNRGSYHGGTLYRTAADAAQTSSDYNIMDRVSTDDSESVMTLAAWQAKGHELHSRSATPMALFVNAAAANYHLLPTSPAVDTGRTIAGIVLDLEGKARPLGAASDIGCYEYAGLPVLTAFSLSPANIKGGGSISGIVTLSSIAPNGGMVVNLSRTSTVAAVPVSITVVGGQKTAIFTIKTVSVTATVVVQITTRLATVSKAANLTVTP